MISRAILSPRAMWQAFCRRDRTMDGAFVIAVRTTGVYCRPSCPSRPKRQNVRFFPTCQDAEAAGYRACRRCHPRAAGEAMAPWAARLVAAAHAADSGRLGDDELRTRGFEPATVRRYFRKTFGLTFQAYCRAARLGRAHQQLEQGTRMTHVALAHGYDSASGFHAAFMAQFGETPGRSREGDWIRLARFESPLGTIVTGACNRGVCLLEFEALSRAARQLARVAKGLALIVAPGEHPHLEQIAAELNEYFAGERREFEVPLAPLGTAFQRRVWKALGTIPYGQTMSYAELAAQVELPGAARAVGNANGANPIAIVVPCHRVVRAGGALGGYGGELWRKKWLLDLEAGQSTCDGV